MRIVKIGGAAALIFASPAALACDLDGYGGHRYFAFANMIGGASPDQARTEPRQNYSPPADATTLQPKPREVQPADKPSTDSADSQSTDSSSTAPQTSSSNQSSVTDDRPSDGAVFR